MRFLPPDEEISLYNEGFKNEILGREKAGKQLSQLLERIEDPLVIALDGLWGTGKTYFLKRWVGAHILQNDGKATTVYFDAFASDYGSDPLPALIGALGERLPRTAATKLKIVQKAAAKFIKPVIRVGFSAVTYGATEVLSDLGDTIAEASQKEADKLLDQFWQREEGRRRAMQEFRSAMAALTTSKGGEVTPLIVVVDELDRCRPDYALEVLEVIKHFFSVPHVHFVLGVNIGALENSVRARYGGGVDAAAYLKKFISLSVTLPDTVDAHDRTKAVVAYARHICSTMDIPTHLSEDLVDHVEIVTKKNHISIRDMGKIISTVSLLQGEAANTHTRSAFRDVMWTLIVTKVVNPELYQRFLNCTVSENEIAAYFGVTSRTLKRLVEGKYNEDYDHRSSIRYAIWLCIIRNGAIKPEETDENTEWVFDQFKRVSRPISDLPRHIQQDWLDLFRIN